jgi:hypothetical protein
MVLEKKKKRRSGGPPRSDITQSFGPRGHLISAVLDDIQKGLAWL